MNLNPEGVLTLRLGDQPYRLHLGMSALAAAQAQHRDEFDQLIAGRLPAGAMPDFALVHALFTEALRRFHSDVADDRFFVDDLIAANSGALGQLLGVTAPDDQPGKAKPAARKTGSRRA